MIKTARKMLSLLLPDQRFRIGLLYLPMFAAAVLDMASIGMVLPMVHALASAEWRNKIAEFIEPFTGVVAPEQIVPVVTVVFCGLFVGKNVLLYLIYHVINSTIQSQWAAFTHRLFALYLGRSLSFHLSRNSAELVRNITTTTGRSFDALRVFMVLSMEGFLMLGTLALLLAIEPAVTAGAGAFLAIFGLVFYRVSGPIFRTWGERAHDIEKHMIQSVNEGIGGIRDVKLLNVGGFLSAVLGRLAAEMGTYTSRMSTAQQIPRLMIESLMVLGFVVVILVLTADGRGLETALGTLALFGMAGLRLIPSMNRILTGASEIKNRTASIEALYADMQNIGETAAAVAVDTGPAADAAMPFERALHINRVSLRYPGAERLALDQFDLVIEPATSVGIVGASGAGKTTLMDVILGLLRPSEGVVTVDGIALPAEPRAWQDRIGFVPQQIFMLDDTLKHNIAFGVADADVDTRRLARAVSLARLDEFVAGLPDGLDSMIGERGTRISGGQRQRVAIARALYRDPAVLVFDEATAALDNETEREITDAIEQLSGDKTVLLIAHRLSTVRNCDVIVFMDQGKIAATGSFDALMASNPAFRRLAELGGMREAS